MSSGCLTLASACCTMFSAGPDMVGRDVARARGSTTLSGPWPASYMAAVLLCPPTTAGCHCSSGTGHGDCCRQVLSVRTQSWAAWPGRGRRATGGRWSMSTTTRLIPVPTVLAGSLVSGQQGSCAAGMRTGWGVLAQGRPGLRHQAMHCDVAGASPLPSNPWHDRGFWRLLRMGSFGHHLRLLHQSPGFMSVVCPLLDGYQVQTWDSSLRVSCFGSSDVPTMEGTLSCGPASSTSSSWCFGLSAVRAVVSEVGPCCRWGAYSPDLVQSTTSDLSCCQPCPSPGRLLAPACSDGRSQVACPQPGVSAAAWTQTLPHFTPKLFWVRGGL